MFNKKFIIGGLVFIVLLISTVTLKAEDVKKPATEKPAVEQLQGAANTENNVKTDNEIKSSQNTIKSIIKNAVKAVTTH
ncbi:MAG: hypothetical protein L3V56_02095 [Candidatus Magnetoovum sp. WYHC-5]|nr:hypothetical protein [Candidatus Magnetoovum sp. WYHC-5]